MRSFGQLEAGQKATADRVTSLEKRMIAELQALRADFNSALNHAIEEMQKAHSTRESDQRSIEKRVDLIEAAEASRHGAWSVGAKVAAAVGGVILTIINIAAAWFTQHAK